MCVRLIGGEPGRYGYNYFVSMIMERLGLQKDLVVQAIWRLEFKDGLLTYVSRRAQTRCVQFP